MKINRKIKLNKKSAVFLMISMCCTVMFLFFPSPVAAASDWVFNLVGGLAQGIAAVLGWILNKLMVVLIQVAQYNNFIKSAAIVNGWVIARDVANMFFIVILLIIAFATILRIENYSYKKWLPKLVLMAILINFSKTICGILIDLSQVVMLTFVNAFKDVAGGSLIDMLGITGWQSLNGIKEVDNWTIASAYVLSVIYIVITLITIAAMLGMLVMRIIMIWVYVVLSPFAYLLAAFPGGTQYSSMWWKEFTKNLIVGPVLAFFIWLSFTSLVSFNDNSNDVVGDFNGSATDITCKLGDDGICVYGTSDLMIKFIIAIAMLLGGMKVAQEIGGAAAGVAGKMADKGNALALMAGAGVVAAGKGLGKWGGRQLGDLRDIASEKMGVDLNLVAGERRRREQVEHNRGLRQARIRKNTLKTAEEGQTWVGRKAALMSTGDIAWQNVMDKKFGVLGAGSPGKNKKYIGKIEDQNTIKTDATKEIDRLKNESQNVVTAAEDRDNQNRIKDINKKNYKLSGEKDAIVNDFDYKKLIAKEKNKALTDDEAKDLAKKKEDIKKIDETVARNQEEKDLLKSKNIVVADKNAKAAKIADYEDKQKASSKAIVDADKEIQKFTDVLRKNKLSEVQSARADINAKLEGEANKKIANFSNPDQLVGIYKEAEEQHDEGLMAATYKKLAKTGNYNDLHRELGIGTGYDGMITMSKRLQDHGGMTQQDSFALIAEIGELAKAVNHFEAFGAMSMNKAGQWEASGFENQQAAILSEKSKVQTQLYARNVNRLGNGSYRDGEPHDAEHWDLSPSTIALLASKDKAYSDEYLKTGNINAIQFIGANEDNLKALEKNGAVETAKVIRDIVAKVRSNNAKGGDVSNPKVAIQNIIK